jgi:hypothetical protein
MNAVLGYGSLIRPSSIAERQDRSWTQAAYSSETDFSLHPDVSERWDEIRDRITVIPVQLSGFERFYSYETRRGGTMLELIPGEDIVNGIILTGLTDDEHRAIASYEDGYRQATLTREKFDPYPVHGLEQHQIPHRVTVYLPDADRPPAPGSVPRKNAIYHRRILQGIQDELGDLFTTTLASRFRSDFLKSTQEAQDGRWTYLR